MTWQLLEPSLIAQAIQCPVLHNLRAADCARGGQGAPLTPLADWCWFRDSSEYRVVINFGGFVNATLLPADGDVQRIRAADICAGNHILDELARICLRQPFDTDGHVALQGEVDKVLYARFRQVLQQQAQAGRSLGSGDELRQALQEVSDQASAPDVLRSAIEAIVALVLQHTASWCPQPIDRFIIAGGGCANLALVQALEQRAQRYHNSVIERSDVYGVPFQTREAMAMARLGALVADGIPISLPHVTGVSDPAPVAGSWTYVCGSSLSLFDSGLNAVLIERVFQSLGVTDVVRRFSQITQIFYCRLWVDVACGRSLTPFFRSASVIL